MDGNDTDNSSNDSSSSTTTSTTTKITSRVAINYLRPALFGFKRPKWLPFHFIIGLFGGHFSPVIGVLDNDDDKDNPLVGIFDVNHTYGGAYLVPAKKSLQLPQPRRFAVSSTARRQPLEDVHDNNQSLSTFELRRADLCRHKDPWLRLLVFLHPGAPNAESRGF